MSKDTETPQATAFIVLDPREKKTDLDIKIPVCLKVVYQREWRAFRTSNFLTVNEFKHFSNGSRKNGIKAVRDDVENQLANAKEVIKSLGDDFTFTRFKEALKGNVAKAKATNLYDYFEKVIVEKKANTTTTTYKVYENSLSNLKMFRKTKPEFKEIDVEYLKRYQSWFLNTKHGQKVKKQRSETTLSIYLRTLRAVLNMAIDDGLMKREKYPFAQKSSDKRKFKIPTHSNIKKALTKADIKKIVEYSPKNEAEAYNRDIWLFSYLCNGMNFKDIALLKYENINEQGIVFIRAKTRGKTQKPIFVPLLPESRAIIERWGNPDRSPENRVFDLIPESTPIERFVPVKNQRIKVLNDYMSKIFENLKLGEYQGLMAARHSFATVMKRSGASIESISEALGHSNIKTTENYLDSFANDEKMKLQQNLVNF
ncbi:MAG: site-specific integrase [Bacteroidia bacterium]